MRKLDLRDFKVKQKIMNSMPGQEEYKELSYFVKDSILNILFLPELKLMGIVLVKQNILAMKIEECDEYVMLEEEEYGRVKDAINIYPAQTRHDAILVDRVLNQTPKIE